MARGQTGTERISVTLPKSIVEYLEDLASTGVHGASVPDVARSLIMTGVQNAIRENFISVRNFANGKDLDSTQE